MPQIHQAIILTVLLEWERVSCADVSSNVELSLTRSRRTVANFGTEGELASRAVFEISLTRSTVSHRLLSTLSRAQTSPLDPSVEFHNPALPRFHPVNGSRVRLDEVVPKYPSTRSADGDCALGILPLTRAVDRSRFFPHDCRRWCSRVTFRPTRNSGSYSQASYGFH